MGYTTDFEGKLTFDKPLTAAQVAYIQAFNNTRRMKRNAEIAATFPDALREAVNLPIGDEGAYYVGSVNDGQMGQKNDKSVLDHNYPAKTQPGLWCQWTVTDDGKYFEWDGGEKFYHYIEWLQYLITHFFSKWDVKLNGSIKWNGEDAEDMGKIYVRDNEIDARNAQITY